MHAQIEENNLQYSLCWQQVYKFFQFNFLGDTSYTNMAKSSIVSHIISSYWLPTLEYSEEIWVISSTLAELMIYTVKGEI